MLDQQLEDNAQAADPVAPTKKIRAKGEVIPKSYPQFNEDGTPVLNEAGEPVWGPEKSAHKKAKAPRKPREPKPVVYQKDEAGNDILDESGNPIPVVKVRGPVVNRVPSNEGSIINMDEANVIKAAKYTGARGQYAVMLKGGITIGEYLQNGGDRGFLRFYIKDGACTVTPFVPAA